MALDGASGAVHDHPTGGGCDHHRPLAIATANTPTPTACTTATAAGAVSGTAVESAPTTPPAGPMRPWCAMAAFVASSATASGSPSAGILRIPRLHVGGSEAGGAGQRGGRALSRRVGSFSEGMGEIGEQGQGGVGQLADT